MLFFPSEERIHNGSEFWIFVFVLIERYLRGTYFVPKLSNLKLRLSMLDARNLRYRRDSL
jgi:hypothetical protein